MKTLKELIEDTKCRKGPAYATTKKGAFWLACDPIKIRSYGGDGIGQSAADIDHHLQLRHFRDGSVQAMVICDSWHQNYGTSKSYQSVNILGCTNIEEVIVALKGAQFTDECHSGTAVYSDQFGEELMEALGDLGMPDCLPSPDEDQAPDAA